jgi:hypothetical protein
MILNNTIRLGYLEDMAGIHDALPPALKAHVRPRFKKPRVELPLAEA